MTREEQAQEIEQAGFRGDMDRHGITSEVLARQLKAELKAKVTKTTKIKGAVSSVPRGVRVMVTSGVIYHDKDGDDYGDGETVLQHDEIAWDVRQRARMDAHKLRGDYPAERHEVNHSGVVVLAPDEIAKPGDSGVSHG